MAKLFVNRFSNLNVLFRNDAFSTCWNLNTSALWRTISKSTCTRSISYSPCIANRSWSADNICTVPKQDEFGRRVLSLSMAVSQIDKNPTKENTEDVLKTKKLGLVAKFKLMYKQYWYVLVPVHVVTSTGWLVGFYYLSKSGVDIPTLLQSLHLSESIVDKLKDSTMGHLAIAYMCYKLVTPVRYMVTIGGTTLSIKYLSQWGYIRPILSKEQFRKIYDDKKAQVKRGIEELQDKSSASVKNEKKE